MKGVQGEGGGGGRKGAHVAEYAHLGEYWMVEQKVVSLIPGAGLKYLGSNGTAFTLQITIPSYDLDCLLRWHSVLQ